MSDDREQQPKADSDRVAEAKRSLREIQQEIAPYVKKRRLSRTTTAGQWRETDVVLRRERPTGEQRRNERLAVEDAKREAATPARAGRRLPGDG